jgi:Ca2+/Na+ antiporter
MKVLDFLFEVSYCMVREDKTGDRHKRAAMLVEGYVIFLVIIISMIVLGLLDIQIKSKVSWIIIIMGESYFVYLLIKKYFLRNDHYKNLISNTQKYRKKKRRYYAFLSAIFLLLSFVLLFGGGILMSYLLSFH